MINFQTTHLGDGDVEIGCRFIDGGDLIAAITHPGVKGAKWFVHPVHASRAKFTTMKAAKECVRLLALREAS